jgi:transaldolase
VIYVENLIGPNTVNTMPASTLEATMDHAEIRPTLEGDADDARRFLEDLREAGVSYEEVVEVLEKEGVQKFAESFEELREQIKSKGRQLVR